MHLQSLPARQKFINKKLNGITNNELLGHLNDSALFTHFWGSRIPIFSHISVATFDLAIEFKFFILSSQLFLIKFKFEDDSGQLLTDVSIFTRNIAS